MGTEPKRYRAKFIEPGIISYEDVGAGTVLVSREALDKMRPSFVGMPVFNFSHNDTDAEEAFAFDKTEKDNQAVGIIAEVGTDNGWDFADMLIWDEETQKNIDQRGFSVSCAYIPTDTKGGGQYHGIDYDEEVLDGEYKHMAIVENPRYEGSTIFQNSKGVLSVKKTNGKWNIFIKKNSTEPPKDDKKPKEPPAGGGNEPPPEEVDNGQDAYVEIDGQKVPLAELVEAYDSKNNAGEEGQALSPEDEVDVGGQKVKVSDLIAAYQGSHENAQVDEPGTKVDTDVIVKNGKAGKEPPNANFIAVKKNAAAVADPPPPKLNTRTDRIANGAARYGSPVPGGK